MPGKKNEQRYARWKTEKWEREVLRTPEERFKDLPGYDFEPNYANVQGLRMHYVDQGPREADPVLLLHGEPSWSFLYRKMIPPIARSGHRVVAPDLIGFGKSDKLAKRREYSYQMYVDQVTEFIEKLELINITLFCQDWGGLIGLRVAAENPERFARIIAANTALPGRPPESARQGAFTGGLSMRSGAFFLAWLSFSQLMPSFSAGLVVQIGTVTKISPEVKAAYDAPFPSRRYKAGGRVFPTLVGTQIEENTRAWDVLAGWEKPFLTAFSDGDPIMRGGDRVFQRAVPGAKGQPHVTIKGGGHFLQEDKGEELAQVVIEFIKTTAEQ